MQSNLLNTSITIELWVFVIFIMNIEVEVDKTDKTWMQVYGE